jgi:hypothetical protein
MFDTDDDAVEKISGTLINAAEQQRLRSVLAGVSEQFSTARFMQQVRDIVGGFRG